MTDPEIFIVRIWRQLAEGFRASARRVDDEETHYFSQPDDVARFLRGRVESKADSDPAEVGLVPRIATHYDQS